MFIHVPSYQHSWPKLTRTKLKLVTKQQKAGNNLHKTPLQKYFSVKKTCISSSRQPILQVLQLFLQALHQRIFIHRRGGFRLDFDVLHRRGEGQGAVALLEIRQGWA